MFSEVLKSSYLQYKEDTNAVASWLAKTAKACGYAVDLLINKAEGVKENQAPAGRPKGKARKQAKEAAKTASTASAPSNSNVPIYTLAIKDFVSLADWIASFNKPPIKVPASFVNAIDRAISVRQAHGELLAGGDEKSDERHNYFIGVLEHVRSALRVRMPAEAVEATNSKADTQGTTTNKFQGLEIEEPSEEYLNAPDISPEKLPEVRYEAERDSLEEAYLAFNLILEDYSKFRTVLSKTWDGYRQGVFNLVSASVMTNTALDLARSLEEDAKPLFDKQGGSTNMLEKFYITTCMARGEMDSTRELPGDELNFRMYKVADVFFIPMYLILDAFLRVIKPKGMPILKPGFFGVYDPSSDRSRKTAREKFKEDKAVLFGILPDFFAATYGTQTLTAEDEFTRGLRTAFKDKKLPLWLIFAAQIYMDIHHILRESISRGCYDLQQVGKFVCNSIKANFEFHASLRVDTWPPSNDGYLRQFQQEIDQCVMHDPLLQKKQKLGCPPELLRSPYALMKSHPLRCGLYAYNIKVRYQEIAITFANAWGSILYTYQLYTAARREKLLKRNWQDMDTIMGLQDDLFGGSGPSDLDGYLKWFALSIGVSATVFAKDRRNGPLPASKTGPRAMLKEQAPVALMFKQRYCSESARVDLTEQDLQEIVSKAVWKEEEEAALPDMVLLSLEGDLKKNRSATTKRSNPHHRPTAEKLLESLRNTLMSESMELNYDYLLFHRMCWRLLRSVHEACRPKLTEMCGPGYLEKESQLPFVVGYIFMAATQTKRLGSILQMKSETGTSELLYQAAVKIDGYIENCGTFLFKIMQEMCGYEIEFEEDSEDEAEKATGS